MTVSSLYVFLSVTALAIYNISEHSAKQLGLVS